jgi:hypothetical protein
MGDSLRCSPKIDNKSLSIMPCRPITGTRSRPIPCSKRTPSTSASHPTGAQRTSATAVLAFKFGMKVSEHRAVLFAHWYGAQAVRLSQIPMDIAMPIDRRRRWKEQKQAQSLSGQQLELSCTLQLANCIYSHVVIGSDGIVWLP